MTEIQNTFQWDSVPWGIIAPILVINFLLVIMALTDCIRADRTNGPKWLWVIVIVFINLLGPILYFVAGRRQR